MEAHLLLRACLALTGNPEAALPNLAKAATLQPESPSHMGFLADAYVQLGREQDAERERSEATRISGNGKH